MLLGFGADPTLVDRQSRSAVDVLKRNKNFRAIDKINSHLEKLAACSKDLSGSWQWTGRPGVLQSMGSQRVRQD